ncbi:MAG TPA: universal stress protein [Propionibacteriaceae bacterium]|nr:universal stress protein [Propionibacteriaceae bacterium]
MTAMRRIVVGVDGSEYSLRALRWAVFEAGRHGAELLALTTWTALPPPIASPYVDVSKAVDRHDGASAAEQALQTVVANAMAGNSPIVVEIAATEGYPAKLLAEQSRHADLVVVGARGRGGIAGWLLGSVSQELLRHSSCPVAVVRSPDKDEVAAAEETLRSEWTRVVVGVDGSDYSKSALRWAAGEAKTHNAELTVASVWTPPPTIDPPYGNIAWGTDLEPQLQATAILQTTMEEVLGEDPGLVVRREVRGGNPASVLIDLSERADALVVGSRGLGGFVGMVLGSVSQHVAAHAATTVIVIR